MAGSLRDFMTDLRKRKQLLVVKKEVDPKFELHAVVRKVQAGPNLPVLFEKVRGTRFRLQRLDDGHRLPWIAFRPLFFLLSVKHRFVRIDVFVHERGELLPHCLRARRNLNTHGRMIVRFSFQGGGRFQPAALRPPEGGRYTGEFHVV